MRRLFRFIGTSAILASTAFACGFKTEPAAVASLYREDGWKLPDLTRGKLSALVQFNSAQPRGWRLGPGPIPGVNIRVVVRDGNQNEPNLFEIPRQEFELNGKRRVMPAQFMIFNPRIWRYDVDGKIFAYTFAFTPVVAQKSNGKWKVVSELACDFDVTFMDDKGDGVFRALLGGNMTPDLVPQWALKPRSRS